MQLSMQISYAGGHKESARQLVRLEQAGLDIAWIAEAYSYDAPSYMGYLAALTERVQIGAGILPLYTRTPTLLAMTAAGIDALSDGRCILGLGASGPQVIEGFHGVPYDKPLARTREIIEIIRSGMRRERLEADGLYTLPLDKEHGAVTGLGKPLKLLTRPERDSVPIYIAALGPKNVEMSAEIADGLIPHLFYPEKVDLAMGEPLKAGAAKRDASLAPLEIVAGGMLAIGEGPETKAMLDFARPIFALYVGGMGAKGKNFYNDLACTYGYEKEAAEIQELYLGGNKRDAEALVPTEWLEAANLVGPASYVKERIAAFAEAGVTSLNVTPVGEDPAAMVGQLKEWVS
jgi:F420-dependent oxidoreductase-like protein